MKRFLPVLVIASALLVILLGIRQCRLSGDTNYQSATVTRGPLTQAVTATGTLNPVVNV
jgi:multidrug efflux pump subunit AcrA (membrane-fusion protein)